jgi:hypothetical protein
VGIVFGVLIGAALARAAAAAAAAPPVEDAPSVRLEWTAPAECIEGAALADAVSGQLGRPAFADSGDTELNSVARRRAEAGRHRAEVCRRRGERGRGCSTRQQRCHSSTRRWRSCSRSS